MGEELSVGKQSSECRLLRLRKERKREQALKEQTQGQEISFSKRRWRHKQVYKESCSLESIM